MPPGYIPKSPSGKRTSNDFSAQLSQTAPRGNKNLHLTLPPDISNFKDVSKTPVGRSSVIIPNSSRSSLTKSAFGSLGKIGKKMGKMFKEKTKDLNLTYDPGPDNFNT